MFSWKLPDLCWQIKGYFVFPAHIATEYTKSCNHITIMIAAGRPYPFFSNAYPVPKLCVPAFLQVCLFFSVVISFSVLLYVTLQSKFKMLYTQILHLSVCFVKFSAKLRNSGFRSGFRKTSPLFVRRSAPFPFSQTGFRVTRTVQCLPLCHGR